MLWEVGKDGLEPADQKAGEWIGPKAVGSTWEMAAPKKVRSPEQHRMFWAMAHKVYENWPDKYETPGADAYEMVKILQIPLGFCTAYQAPSGEVIKVPESLSFGNMDGDRFAKVFDRFKELWCAILGCTEEDLLGD